jgi:cytochrome c oxidase subunit 3/cytochrome o ubiquinol oxidase subunit 3
VDHAAAATLPDAHPDHLDTSTGVDSRKLAFWTFIGSECLLFGTLIATYMVYKGASRVPPYPHDTVVNGQTYKGILDIPLTSLSTFILLMSSVAMVLALSAVQRGDRAWGRNWLIITAGLGAIFLGFQVYEFNHFYHAGLKLSTNLFGATFFTLTGFHGAHVTAGVIYLLTLALLVHRGRIGPEKSITVEIAGLYWHFVDVIWIVIFPLVYLIR